MPKDTVNTVNTVNTVKSKSISDSAIKRLSAQAGISRLGASAYNEIRAIIHEYLIKIIGYSIVLMEHANRKTLMLNDVTESIDLLNLHSSHGSHKSRKKSPARLLKKNTRNAVNALAIKYNSFSNTVRDIAKTKTKTKKTPRIADDAIQKLQEFTESKMITLLKDSKRNAIHSKRATVQSEDIRLAYSYHC